VGVGCVVWGWTLRISTSFSGGHGKRENVIVDGKSSGNHEVEDEDNLQGQQLWVSFCGSVAEWAYHPEQMLFLSYPLTLFAFL
jgi:hypothetical protein